MTRYLEVDEVLRLHSFAIFRAGGSLGLRDEAMLESAVAQPQMTFGGRDLYASLVEKAAAIGFSLASNHAFVDGNKRVGHAAMETFLVLNGKQIVASVDEQEATIAAVAAGELDREAFTGWLSAKVRGIEN